MVADAPDGKTDFRKTTLDSGMRVLTSAVPHTRAASVSVFVGVGSRYDSPDQAGISHVVEHMVFKGTKRRPSAGEISVTIEGVGGILNAGTEHELTVYWCKVARPYLDEALDLLIDMLRDSLYEPAEIERERMVVIEEQNMANDNPGHRVDVLMDQMLWPDHPLGRDISGTRESVSGMTREMLLDHVSMFYTPRNIVMSVAGDVDHDKIARTVESLSDGWSSHDPAAWAPFTHVQSAPQLRVEYRRTEQAHLLIGLPGLSVTHPDRYALDLLSAVLGEGMSSRLFLEVREKRGLAYDIHSGVTHFLDTGAFVVEAGVDPKRAYAAVDTVLAELARLKDGVPDSELVRAKRLSTGMLMLRMEDTRAVSSWTGSQELLLGEVQDVDQVTEQVESVTTEDLRRVANDLLTGDKLNMALVGPVRGEARLQRALSQIPHLDKRKTS